MASPDRPDADPPESANRPSFASAETEASSEPPRAPIALPDGTTLRAEYQVGAVLGTGSFGVTYRCRDTHLDTPVAIKEYYPRHLAGRPDASTDIRPHTAEDVDDFEFGLNQFRQEGRTLARFDHPNIVDVRSYFEENGTGYLVMDYYEGETLADHLSRHGGQLPESKAVGVIQDILKGLQPVHEAGILHRDIDPNNIYLTDEDRAVLIDFGAAREAMGLRSQSLSVILKPGYAPFEQYSTSGDQGPPTDIYACAATLYKCLTGLRPPDATDRLQHDELVSPREVRGDISLETSVAVMKGLHLDPDRRPASVAEFSALLEDASPTDSTNGAEGSHTAPTPTPSPPETSLPSSPTELPDRDGDTAVPAETSSTRTEILSTAGLSIGVLGTVGGTLLLSDTNPLEILSFFVTWIAVCLGLVWMFREGEKVMSGESRASVSDWLLREDFAESRSNWPKTFIALFDAIFTEHHLSWTCVRRSALTSLLVMTMLLGGFVGIGMIPLPSSLYQLLLTGVILLLPLSLNIVVDYVSLFETRWILGRMSQSRNAFVHAGYLVADLLLTLLCILTPFLILQVAGISLIGGIPVDSSRFWQQLVGAVQNVLELFFALRAGEFGGLANTMSIMLFSTTFTSVWVWLYVGAGLLLRALRPVLESLDVLKRHLNVETRPIHTMGVLLALLTSLGFAASAPFVL